MSILVTGATGFIGQALTRRLLEDGQTVRVLVRDRARFERLGLNGAEVVIGDITDATAVKRAIAGTELVYSIAGTFREPDLPDRSYWAINVDAVGSIVQIAARHRLRRVVHCSTVGIHGDVTGPPAAEDAPIVPDGIYEVTKAAGDRLARERGREQGIEVVVVRPAPVYGEGDTRLLKLFKLAGRKQVLLLGPGTTKYHLVHIDDLVDAFVRAGTTPGVGNEAFIVAGPDRPNLNELIGILAQVLGNPDPTIIRLPAGPVRYLGHLCEEFCRPLGIAPPLYRRRVDFFIQNRSYDIAKARARLGYSPQVELEAGLTRTAAWYRREKLL